MDELEIVVCVLWSLRADVKDTLVLTNEWSTIESNFKVFTYRPL